MTEKFQRDQSSLVIGIGDGPSSQTATSYRLMVKTPLMNHSPFKTAPYSIEPHSRGIGSANGNLLMVSSLNFTSIPRKAMYFISSSYKLQQPMLSEQGTVKMQRLAKILN